MPAPLALRKGRGPQYFVDEPLLSDGFLVAFSTRNGGASLPPFDSLNLALHLSDAPATVLDNRERFASAVELDPRRLTYADQVHGSRVALVGESSAGAGHKNHEDAVSRTDALVTDLADTGLVILTADCLPIALIDKKRRLAAVVHAGWRGTLDGVGAAAVRVMEGKGAVPADIEVRFGPAIGECCYEVGADVFAGFAGRFGLPSTNSPRLNLSKLNRDMLIEAGVRPENIVDLGICTMCRADLFFSYRRDGLTGRQASVVARSTR